ncbi:MAG: zinc ABC transporter solute-binding protein [Candidatus Omnitrophica bacterium]|nr:zinc ABC transporter solute-binding protein [Candidatus Omnitrophota bacterium]
MRMLWSKPHWQWLMVALAAAGWLLYVAPVMAQSPEPSAKVRVVTTLFPLYDFVRIVGGERVEAVMLVPPGSDPYGYQPQPSDLETINSADIFLYASEATEPWVEPLLPSITNQNLLIMAAANSAGAATHLQPDAAVWLNLSGDPAIVDDVVDDLVTADESGRDYYLARASEYKERLIALERRYEAALQDCRNRTMVFYGQPVFAGLARKHHLILKDCKTAEELVNVIKESGVGIYFFSDAADVKLMEGVSEKTGVRQQLLSSAAVVTAEQLRNGTTFLGIMEEDLAGLRQGLECR